MARPETAWTAEHSRHFSHYDKSMRGRVRYEVVRHNLASVLGEFLSTPRKVIDVGGGKGEDAKWIAKVGLGHEVFMFEPDRESRAEAVKGNDGLIQIIDGNADTALSPSYYGPEAFDLVLSHGVLMYQSNPAAELAKLAQLTRPGGYLSLLNAGMFGKLNRFQEKENIAAVDKLRLSGRFTNNLGVEAFAFLPQDMDKLIQSAGLETIGWFGVRILSDQDNRPVDEVDVSHQKSIIDAEISASSDPRLRSAGQMLHYIVRKA